MPYVPLAEALDQALGALTRGYVPDSSADRFPDHRAVLPPLLEVGALLYCLADEYDLIAPSISTSLDWSAMLQSTGTALPSIPLHPREH